ncbi:hypothetical protein PoB_007493200 [Plakobranchus ocellatus]|uniref:Uncharacterized protein n=1 Tax=Plakobranchus ocellatus TaxID=259542 RepID=A0AAV4DWN0_9GAST|nr:hypothetical protein PoB_007493200 [Plakobranchus ocellatus]
MSYPGPPGAQAAYDSSGQQPPAAGYGWSPMQAGWNQQQQAYPYQPAQQHYAPQASNNYVGQGYVGEGGAATYRESYSYSNGAYEGYVGQGPSGEQFGSSSSSQHYGTGDSGQFMNQGWSAGQQQQWGWDQNSNMKGVPSNGEESHTPTWRGRGGRGGPPAFGGGRGARGRGDASYFDKGKEDGPFTFSKDHGGSSSRGGSFAFGSGRGGPPAFGSGRGTGGDRGRGIGGDRGRSIGGDRGRGIGGDRGRGISGDRNRGRGNDAGRGGRGRDDAGQGRGGGARFERGRGRGSAGMGDRGGGRGRGRGGGTGGGSLTDRGRGRGGSGNTRGRGGPAFGSGRGGDDRGRHAVSESVTVADTGVGLASIGDLIKSAQQRRLQGMTKGLSPDAPLSDFVERWKTFSRDFVDCGNPISNLECSLKASKLDLLQLRSETDLLFKVSNTYNIFTSTLILVKKFAPLDHRDQETAFLARGLGLNKKAAKADCYQKAHKLLMDCSVTEIMSQTDTDESTLRQEIQILHKDNPRGFMDLLKKTTETTELGEGDPQRPKPLQAPKRKAPAGNASDHGSAKKPRPLMGPEDYAAENQSSLAPKKKQGILMQRSAPLQAKLAKLKELLKEEGITKLHIVPKIDQFAHKTAVTIRNVYKYIDIPSLGFENKTPLYCEIYFDDTWVAASEPSIKRNTAMHEAYCNFTDILCSKSVEEIASNPRRWSVAMESMPDVCTVVTKWQGEDNDSLLTSNLANMKQMMQAMPQVKFPVNKMVLTEHETDKNIENVFKSLELSATRNLVLLECEILRNSDHSFTCNISLQGKVMATRIHSVKNVAKRLASEAVMKQLQKTNDFIFVAAEYVGQTYTKSDLFKKAQEKRDAGLEPPSCVSKIIDKVLVKKPPDGLTPEALKRYEEDLKASHAVEEQQENKNLRPLLPYLAMVVYEIIDNHYEKLSLEDIIFDVRGMARSQREVIGYCAGKMGMRINTKVRNKEQASLLRRCITAQDMSKMLQIHGGTSGRYKLTKCHNPCSQKELDEFQEQYLSVYKAYKSSRDLDEELAATSGEKAPPKVSNSPARPAAKKDTAKPSSAVSAWENNEPLKFKGSPTSGAVEEANVTPDAGSRPAPPDTQGPRPLLPGPRAPLAKRAPRPTVQYPGPPRKPQPLLSRPGQPLQRLPQLPPRQMHPHMRHPPPLRHPLPPRQPRPERMSAPGPRVGGHFQY